MGLRSFVISTKQYMKKGCDLFKDSLSEPKHNSNKISFETFIFFLRFARPYWNMGLLVLCLTIISSVSMAMIPMGMKFGTDYVLSIRQAYDEIDLYVIGAGLVLIIIACMFNLMRKILVLRFEQRITRDLQVTLFERLLYVPIAFFKKQQVGYLMSRVQDDVQLVQLFFSNLIPQLLFNTIFLAASCVMITIFQPSLVVLLVCCFLVFMGLTHFFSGRIRRIAWSERERQANISMTLQELLSGIHEIKMHCAHQRAVERFRLKIDHFMRTVLKSTLLMVTAETTVSALKYVILLIAATVCIKKINSQEMTAGDCIAFLTYVIVMFSRSRIIIRTILTLQTAAAAMERLIQMLKLETEHHLPSSTKQLLRPGDFSGRIEFEKVCFSYDRDHEVLKDLSFCIEPSQLTLLTGPSGAGKTTLINLLIKFYQPNSGTIRLNGMDIRAIDTFWLRKQIGFVSQDIFLFNDTIENNIRYADPTASDADIREAAEKARIHEDIMNMPNQYRSLVGEKGLSLSAGQRQRISVARALLKDPKIIIMDEPTANLDEQTQAGLFEGLHTIRKSKTVLIITHRLTLAGSADQILYLNKGRIVLQNKQCIPEHRELTYELSL